MGKIIFIMASFLLFFNILIDANKVNQDIPYALLCEWKVNNTNVKDIKPEFSWKYNGNQSAFQILVSSSIDNISCNIGDMWDSNLINDTKNFTEYDGIPLKNNETYYWRVIVWDEGSKKYSRISTFKTNFSFRKTNFNHIRTFLVGYGNFNESQKQWIASHFDLTINENIHAYNPNATNLKYVLFATMVIPSNKAQKLMEFCNETGANFEDVFLHLNRDTNFTLPISNPMSDDWPVETRTVKGWDPANDINGDGYVNDTEFENLVNPNATARYRNESRVPIYYWNPPDYVMNIGNKDYQKFIVNYSLGEINDYDGLFIDTTASVIPVPSTAKKNIAEYPQNPDEEWQKDMQYLLARVKKAMPDKILVGNGWFAEPLISDGRMLECWKNIASPISNAWNSYDDFKNGLDAIIDMDKKGEIQLIQYNAGMENVSMDRDLIFGLASYYLVHGNFTYFFVGKHPYINVLENWFDAISFDIGKPKGKYYIFNTSFDIIPQENIIKNGGFEIDSGIDFYANRSDDNCIANDSKPDGWIPCEPVEMVKDIKHSGNYSVMINATDYNNNNINKQYVSLEKNTSYTLRGWIKTLNVKKYGAQIYAWEFENATSCFLIQKGTKDWNFYSKIFQIKNDTYGRINFRIHGNGTAWFDDISLIKGAYYDYKVFARDFERALVVVKPKLISSYPLNNETISIHKLNGIYFPLHANGKVGNGINKISLRYGEAAILIKPDFYINNISFSPNNPKENENFSIFVSVKNDLNISIDNVTIAFYIDSLQNLLACKKINFTNGSAFAETGIKLKKGLHKIYAFVDFEKEFADANFSNNIASKKIYVYNVSTMYVDDDFNETTLGYGIDHFNNIQDAINKINENGTVYVYDGIYYQNVIINKSLILIGKKAIVDGSLSIISNWVNISGFTIKNANYGIKIESSFNNICNCNISECYYGILINGSNNKIFGNTIKNNEYGIVICSSFNLIFYNNFMNSCNAYDSGSNSWDNDYPYGNYWNDYNGSDLYHGENQSIPGSDGIGDTPYEIEGGENVDRYPLIFPVFSFELYKGWNLISLPYENYNASSLYKIIEGCKIILAWNTSKQDFCIYVPHSPYNFDIEVGKSYFVAVTKNTTFHVAGLLANNISIPLLVGWNFLGWFKENITLASSLYENITACNIILKWNSSSQNFMIYVSSSPYDFEIKRGDGLIIAVSEQSIWHGEG